MHRPLVLVLSLSLLGCATTQPAQLAPLPVVSTVTLLPLPAASIITPIILLALTLRPLREIQISLV